MAECQTDPKLVQGAYNRDRELLKSKTPQTHFKYGVIPHTLPMKIKRCLFGTLSLEFHLVGQLKTVACIEKSGTLFEKIELQLLWR